MTRSGVRGVAVARDPFAFGTQSTATAALQRALTALGLYPGAIDGIFGPQTRDGVVAARAHFGLSGEAGVDAALLARLGLAGPPLPDVFSALRLLPLAAAVFFPSQPKGLIPMNVLAGYKTYIVAAAMLIAGIAGLLGVNIPNFTGEASGNLVMEALAFFFLRKGLKSDLGRG